MNKRNFNDAIVGNKNIKATISKNGELLRMYYPDIDFRQFIELFHVGVKVNDSAIIYLHDDINNRYYQYYAEDTNILNTEISNTYFKLLITQTDFASLKENMLIRKYTFANDNKVDLDLSFIIRSKLFSDYNNMVSCKVIDNGMIQYAHDFSIATFSNKSISGHRINDIESQINEAILNDKDYIGMSNDSGVTYNLGTLKPGEKLEFNLFMYIQNNNVSKSFNIIEEKAEELKRLDTKKEYTNVKKYWKRYIEKHDGLNLLGENKKNSIEKLIRSDNNMYAENLLDIYKRTILLFPLLQNDTTGGFSSAVEIDEERKYSGRYSYCWPRDAVFVAKACDKLKMVKETEKFYDSFCQKTQSRNGMWEQRFYTDGRLAPCWGYQIDETASVIHGVYEHYKETKNVKFLDNSLKMCENAIDFIFRYLENLFDEQEENPDVVKNAIIEDIIKQGKQKDKVYKHLSYDIWEMNEGIHLYSLASIYSALIAMKKIYEIEKPKFENNRLKIEKITKNDSKIEKELENIKKYINENLYNDKTKTLRRNIKDEKTDISVLGTVYPFEVFNYNDKRIQNTIEKINLTLRTYTGGYLRFEQDTYMGGKNPWPIATLWMAMYYIGVGNKNKAWECLAFVLNTCSDLGFLAEQVSNNTMMPEWIIGLGWSHAMFIIVLSELLK